MKKWFLGKKQTAKSSSVIWNTISGLMIAGQSAIILIFISRRFGLEIAGMVTIAYALAQLFYAVARYGVRNYQVTDVTEQASFRDYFVVRLITLAGSGTAVAVYLVCVLLVGSTSPEKAGVILEVVILNLITAFEDVFVGRFQQVGRLDIGAKIVSVRMIASTALICVTVWIGAGIHTALLFGILCSVVLDIWFIGRTFRTVCPERQQATRDKVWNIFKACLPLCIGTTLMLYVGNAPKYMINWYMDEATQAIFGYIMMPVFVVTLLNQFIYQPMIKDLGDLWARRAVQAFRRRVFRQCMIVGGLIVAALIVGMTIGLPVLTFIYGTDLTGYKMEFAILLIGGGFYALASYLNVPITTIRHQKSLAMGYLIASIAALVTGRWFVLRQGMMGAAILYLVITALLAAIYFVVLMIGIRKGDLHRNDNTNE